MRRLLIILLFFIINSFSYSQKYSDSIISVIDTCKSELTKAQVYFNAAKETQFVNSELSSKYAKKTLKISIDIKNKELESDTYVFLGLLNEDKADYKKSIKYFNKALAIKNKIGEKKGIARVYNNIGSMYDYLGKLDSALFYYDKSIKINKSINNSVGIADTKYNIGLVYYVKSNYDLALANWYEVIDVFDSIKDYEGISACQQQVGIALSAQGKKEKALDFLIKSRQNALKSKDDRLLCQVTMSLGNLYLELDKVDKALYSFRESKNGFIKFGDIVGIAASETNIGDCYRSLNKIDSAIVFYKLSNEKFKKQNVIKGEIHTLIQLAETYRIKKDYKLSVEYSNQATVLAKEINSMGFLSDIYFLKFQAYNEEGDYKNALKYHIKYKNINDSIFNDTKQGIIEELQTKYETEKKDQALKIRSIEYENEKIKLKEKTHQTNFILLGLALSILLIVIVLFSYKQKSKANKILNKQKIIISDKNEELNQLVEEITVQRDEISLQKNKIEDINQKIGESIDYARNIQTSILPSTETLKKHLSEYFVLFKPKDKVSGDFYWWAHVENHTVITAVDCTGHGVPGAFMSMLGASFLREIVQKEYVTHTGVILRKLRKELIKSLKQKGEMGEQKDGMDMAIISINHETNVVQFSGANNPLYIVKSEKLKVESEMLDAIKLFDNSKFKIKHSKLLYEVKPDKMPIAFYVKMDNFSTHEIQLEKGDQLFIFSDGYADQFGGPKGKKFKYKPLKKLLLENAEKPMQEQKEILEKVFEDWQGNMEQIDDVVVVGIKI